MAIYDSALYKKKLWFVYDLTEASGNYKEEYRLKMRKESQKLQFFCPECGEQMMLCAGAVMEPYFRHYSDTDCSRAGMKNSGMTYLAKRILYHYCKDTYPNANILEHGLIEAEGFERVQLEPDFLLEFEDKSQRAIHYLSCEMKLEEWEEKHLIYQSLGIEDEWFLNAKHFRHDRLTTFEYLISKYYEKLYYLDYKENSIFIKKSVKKEAPKENYRTVISADEFDLPVKTLSEKSKETAFTSTKEQQKRKEYRMHTIEAKHLLSANNGMNIYRGCTHGCIYCDARSTCYQMKHDFEDIEVKINAPALLEEELRRKRKPCMVATGAMSDPYMHIEEELGLTRKCLEIIRDTHCGLVIQTKSSRILRDLDLLDEINKTAKCVVQITITTHDDELCKLIEPNVCPTSERIKVLKILQEHKIPTVVWMTPILPYINDTVENITSIVNACADADVYGIITFGIGLTLRDGDRQYYYKNLDRLFPGMKGKYIKKFGNDYELPSEKATELSYTFRSLCNQYAIKTNVDTIFSYLHTYESKLDGEQLSLF